jgi:Na+-transporting NADH:ubiquinone oxidoreductase subunit NqrE
MLIYTHCWELMNSVGSHGSSSLPFMMKVIICHFVSDSHEVMTALIVVLPLIVVVEISSATSSILYERILCNQFVRITINRTFVKNM